MSNCEIIAINKQVLICGECEALFLDFEPIKRGATGFYYLSVDSKVGLDKKMEGPGGVARGYGMREYLESQGLEPTWDSIKIIEEIADI